jgi:hypothetical protein
MPVLPYLPGGASWTLCGDVLATSERHMLICYIILRECYHHPGHVLGLLMHIRAGLVLPHVPGGANCGT